MLNEILTQLSTTAVVMAIAGWLLKTWISNQFRNLEATHEQNLALKLEETRAQWAKDVARLSVHENYLHTRRVALIEEMHEEAVEAEGSLQMFLVSWWATTNKEELEERGFITVGVSDDDRDATMEKRGEEFCGRYLRINATLHKNAIFFKEEFTEAIRAAYQPFFEAITAIDYNALPPIPEQYKDVVESGRAPRRAVVALFRSTLGVTQRGLELAET